MLDRHQTRCSPSVAFSFAIEHPAARASMAPRQAQYGSMHTARFFGGASDYAASPPRQQLCGGMHTIDALLPRRVQRAMIDARLPSLEQPTSASTACSKGAPSLHALLRRPFITTAALAHSSLRSRGHEHIGPGRSARPCGRCGAAVASPHGTLPSTACRDLAQRHLPPCPTVATTTGMYVPRRRGNAGNRRRYCFPPQHDRHSHLSLSSHISRSPRRISRSLSHISRSLSRSVNLVYSVNNSYAVHNSTRVIHIARPSLAALDP